MSDVLELIKARHSSRMPYDGARRIPDEALAQLLEAARWTPTAHNMQNFEIVVADDPALLERLGAIGAELSETFLRENYAQLSMSEEALRARKVGILGTMFPPSWRTATPDMARIAGERGHASLHDTIQESPLVLVVTYDPAARAPASEGDFLGVISLGCLLENLWLTAESLGLGCQVMSVFGGGSVEGQVKEILAIPARLRIAFALRVGYAKSPPRGPRVRRDIADFVHRNRFGNPHAG